MCDSKWLNTHVWRRVVCKKYVSFLFDTLRHRWKENAGTYIYNWQYIIQNWLCNNSFTVLVTFLIYEWENLFLCYNNAKCITGSMSSTVYDKEHIWYLSLIITGPNCHAHLRKYRTCLEVISTDRKKYEIVLKPKS